MQLIGRQAVDAADADAVRAGLMADPPVIASALLYDPLGCRLFEAITDVPEYYPTRTEAAIMADNGDAIADSVRAALGADFQIVDLGAGNCAKGEALVHRLRPTRYVAVDVAADFIAGALARMTDGNPGTEMVGVGVDFSAGFVLPPALADRPTLYFWPGSSIGNFAPDQAAGFVAGLGADGHRAALLLGVDLAKDAAVLTAAYDDAAGVTAAFNRNILAHVNRLAGTDFIPDRWRHVAVWNAAASRIEMWLAAQGSQPVRWPGGGRDFADGARIRTEISVKWTDAGLSRLWNAAGATRLAQWHDRKGWFAVVLVRLGAA